MFSFTISTSISQCFPTIQAGSIALFVAVTYLPSPNLYFVSLLNILIFLILFFNKHDLWIHKPMFSCNCFCVGRIDDCGWCRFHQKDFLFRYIFCHQDNITFFIFWELLRGHVFAHCNFESHIAHLHILPFLSNGLILSLNFLYFLLENVCSCLKRWYYLDYVNDLSL